ncbi:MAG: hypothetical protein ACI39F_06180 [Acutalibacteraceae bacterium]
MGNSRMKKPEISFKGILLPDHFRTVGSFDYIKAPSEIPVVIEVKNDTKKKLDFKISWDGEIYAYARCTPEFLKLSDKNDVSQIGDLTASLNDWDDKFALTFDNTDDNKEYSYFVSKEDVIYLLNNCCRIPEQK